MKRISLLLIVYLVFALTGCQNTASENQNTDVSGGNTSAVEAQGSDNSDAPSVSEQSTVTTSQTTAAVEAQNSDNSDVSFVSEQNTSAASQTTTAPILDTQKPNISGGIVEITENLFVSQLNDVYLNQEDYIGKKIKYEGMFMQYHLDETNMTYYSVYRNSPGCCGADGQAGFEVVWPEGSDKAYLRENDWCEVVGTLATYDEDGQSYLHIVLSSLTVLEKRGAEFVSQ